METILTPNQTRTVAKLEKERILYQKELDFVEILCKRTKKDYPSLTLYEFDILLSAFVNKAKSLKKQTKNKENQINQIFYFASKIVK